MQSLPTLIEPRDGPPAGRLAGEARRWQVLVADDDDDVRLLVAEALRADGMAVAETRSGTDCLKYLAWMVREGYGETSLDLIVSDVWMPGASGLDVLGALGRVGWSVPVILITAFPDWRFHVEARRSGAVAVFEKPIDVAALRRFINSVASS